MSFRRGLLFSLIANAIALAVTAETLRHVTIRNAGDLIAAALVFGLLNTVLKPITRLLTLPLAIFTLGLAWFFVSMLMLELTQALVSGVTIHGFWTLVSATIIVWAVNVVVDGVAGTWRREHRARSRRRWANRQF